MASDHLYYKLLIPREQKKQVILIAPYVLIEKVLSNSLSLVSIK
jgi:hypothetical protein